MLSIAKYRKGEELERERACRASLSLPRSFALARDGREPVAARHGALSRFRGPAVLFRKEVIQPHLPVRLPCYDLAPVTSFTLGRSLRLRTSGTPNFHGLTGGVYKARERIHRAVDDARLLAIPASRGRVAALDLNWPHFFEICSTLRYRCSL